ncbi:TcfC E-set like domain-containing protein [Vibrio alginolyticus]|uniref:TcfC E-set like domain-containing protein n=1 Tax=Vibrio alginolyticus TaxID=663 RepID=UPI0035BFF938
MRIIFKILLSFLCLSASHDSLSIPQDFVDLQKNETVVVDLIYKGSNISTQLIKTSTNSFQFMEPQALIKDIEPFISSNIDSISYRLTREQKILTKRYCIAYPNQCNPESESIVFVYDVKNNSLEVHIKEDLQRKVKQYKYHSPNRSQERALLQSNALSIRSNFEGSDAFSLRTNSTLGLDKDTHLFFSGYTTHDHESNESNIDSAYMRHGLNERWYFKFGKLSPNSQSHFSEGLFNYNLLPQKEIRGIQLGTGMQYFNTNLSNDDKKIEIFSVVGGRADIYQNNVFISSANLYPGYTKIDTSAILGGFSREIDIHIYENGKLSRIDSHSLVSNSRLSDGLPQWLVKSGIDEDGDDIIEFATWYQANRHINWLNDISLSGQMNHNGWFSELGVSTSNSYISHSNIAIGWSNHIRFMLGNKSGDSTNHLSLNSSLSNGKSNLNIGYKRSYSERCLRNDIISCAEEFNLSVGTSIYGNSIRLSHDIRNKYFDISETYYKNNKRESSTLSFSRYLPIKKVRARVSSSISHTRINNDFKENNFYINLSLSLRGTPDFYSVNSSYSNEGIGLGAGYNYSDLDKELGLRAVSNKGQSSTLSGSSRVEMYDKGKVSTSFSVSESNHNAFLGYSLGLALTENGVFSTGPASFSNNLSAVMLTTDNDRLPTHQIKTNSKAEDIRPSFNKITYPFPGYKYSSYIINESRVFNEEKIDTIKRGTGRRDILLTPGHLYIHDIISKSERYYLGKNHKLSANTINSKMNNLTSLDIDDYGNYFIISNSDIDGFHIHIDNEAYFCKFSNIDTSNDINKVNTTSCKKI